FAPADDPRLVMLVLLDEPQNERWGSEVAAPVFAAIGGAVLRYLEVPPRDAAPLQIVTGQPGEGPAPPRVRLAGAAAGDRLMPDLRGLTLRQALAALAPLRPRLHVAGRGLVVEQTPAPGETLAPDGHARLALTAAGHGAPGPR
ncbi:MAG TPA: PASTA domain-containing protein, partial [Methylomirabilota bacterium]|nr:PASTA domain-containing protein [Methylomirabilota bacterium]